MVTGLQEGWGLKGYKVGDKCGNTCSCEKRHRKRRTGERTRTQREVDGGRPDGPQLWEWGE
jgi:hypothetical protein